MDIPDNTYIETFITTDNQYLQIKLEDELDTAGVVVIQFITGNQSRGFWIQPTPELLDQLNNSLDSSGKILFVPGKDWGYYWDQGEWICRGPMLLRETDQPSKKLLEDWKPKLGLAALNQHLLSLRRHLNRLPLKLQTV